MRRPFMLIVTGRPATGKTRLARQLACDLSLPMIPKDGIKESLFDSLGVGDRAYSRRLGAASIHLQRTLAEELLSAGAPVILECNFREDQDGEALRALAERRAARVAQIWLSAAPEALVTRWERRASSGQRHRGHVELDNVDEFLQTLRAPGDAPLRLPGPVMALETTNLQGMDYAAVLAFVTMELDGARSAGRSS